MIHFRIRDYFSVLLYRWALAPLFGGFGRGVRIVWPLRIVGSRFIRLQDGVTLQYGAYVAVTGTAASTPLLQIGSGTLIGNYAHIVCSSGIEIGSRVLIADRVYISDNQHEYRDVRRAVLDQPVRQLRKVVIGSGSWIGENACIIGCRVGENCVIGANSVVIRDIPDRCVAVGAPAVPVKRYCADSDRWRDTDSQGNFRA
jgi:acetyltransferase-like isoleucine patch superfamily enzyme